MQLDSCLRAAGGIACLCARIKAQLFSALGVVYSNSQREVAHGDCSDPSPEPGRRDGIHSSCGQIFTIHPCPAS